MRRRGVLGWIAAAPAALSLAARKVLAMPAAARVRPGQPGWPTDAEWARLAQVVGGRLDKVETPRLEGAQAEALLRNPFYLRDTPAFTGSSGWVDAWRW